MNDRNEHQPHGAASDRPATEPPGAEGHGLRVAPAAVPDQWSTPTGAAPVVERRRHASLDVIRGLAILGILPPNILAFGWPSDIASYTEEMVERTGNPGAVDFGFAIIDILLLTKMMTLFAMLFGAGAVMYARKFEGQSLASGAALWYRRLGWLAAAGLAHGVFFWYGDILLFYAVCGMGLVWWAQRWPIVSLLGSAAGLAAIGLTLGVLLVTTVIPALESLGGAGEYGPDEYEIYTGGYLGALGHRLVLLIGMWPFFYIPVGIPALTATMLVGIALVRLGVFTAERSAALLGLVAVTCTLAGLGLTAAARFMLPDVAGVHEFLFQVVAQPIALIQSTGYAAALAWCVRVGALRPVTFLLAQAGRMAFSNYLLQTVICTTIFYGHGFGRFGTIGFPELWLVVLAVWVINLGLSVAWLSVFRMGPAEWAWRSLTYWKLQPLLRPAGGGSAASE